MALFKGKKAPVQEKTDAEMVRRFKTNPFLFVGTIIILIIVVVAFVLVPAIVPNSGGAGADLTFGYYDKDPISYVPGNYFAQYYDMIVRYRQNTMTSENLSFAGYQMWREAFEAAAVHTAMLKEMKNAGYTAPAKLVDRNVAQLPQFQENGRFSPALYRQMDDNQRLSLWRQVQEDIGKERFRADITGLLKPSAESDFIAKMAERERSFGMAVFSVDAYPDEEYTAYAKEHPELFRSVHLSMITVNSSEREAQQILASIKNGETTFEDAARAHSKDNYADKGGDMGIKMTHELNTDIPESDVHEKIIAVAKGEYSDVLKTGSGWAFFRAEDSIQETDISDPAAMEKVRVYVRNFERGRMEDWATAQADSFIAMVQELGFEEALLQKGLQNRSFGPIPLNYGNVDLFTSLASQSINELSGAETNETFWKTAFTTPLETPSSPIVQGGNVLVLFPTTETTAQESTGENIKSTYNSYWLAYMAEMAIQQHFMNSPKMEDKFIDTYFRYFMAP